MTDRDVPPRCNPDRPNQLSSELGTFLRQHQYAALLHATDLGTALLVKAPAEQIEGLRDPVPVLLRHEMYRHPSSPVIRTLLRFYDRPHEQPPSSLAFESFVSATRSAETDRDDRGMAGIHRRWWITTQHPMRGAIPRPLVQVEQQHPHGLA